MAEEGNVRLHSSRAFNPDPVQAHANEADHIDHLSGRFPLRLRVSGNQWDEQTLRLHTLPAVGRYIRRFQQPVWTYDHNWRTIPAQAWGPISVLASVHSPAEAREAREHGYAPALLTPTAPSKTWKDQDLTMVHCPNETRGMLCIDCQLCFKSDWLHKQSIVIVFTPHGTREKHIRSRYADGSIT